MEQAKRKYEEETAGSRRPAEIFTARDGALLSTKNFNLKEVSRKLTSKFGGPFKILALPAHATNPNVVWFKVPRVFKISTCPST